MANYKGAVVIDTKLDTSKITSDFKEISKKTQNLINKYNRSVDSIKSQELAISKVQNKLNAIRNGDVIPPSLKELGNQLGQDEKEFDKINKRFSELQQKKNTTIAEDNEINKLQQALKDLQQIIAEIKEELNSSLGTSIEAQQLEEQLSILNSKLLQTKTQASQTGLEIQSALKEESNFKLGDKIDSLKDKFASLSNTAGTFCKKIIKLLGVKGIGKQFDKLGGKVERFGKRITRLIGAVAIFNLLRSLLSRLREGFISLLNADNNFNTSLNQIKGNLKTAFVPIYNAILPAINTLMSALVQVTATISRFINSLFGINTASAVKQAKKLSNALNDAAESSGSLASFDKLEVLSDNSSGSNSGGGVDYSSLDQVNTKLLETLNTIKSLISNGEWGVLAELISQAIIKGLDKVINVIKSFDWEGIGTKISDFITNIDFSNILPKLIEVYGEAVLALQKMLLAIDWGKFSKNLSKGIRNAIFKFSDYIKKIKWSDIAQKLSDAFTNFDWSGVGSAIITAIWNAFMGMWDLILGIDWSAVGTTISNAVHEWIDTIIDLFLNTDWQQLGKDIVDAIFDFWESVDWWGLAEDMIKGFVIGIVSLIDLVIGAFKELLKRILEFFGIHSPSTVFAEIGNYIMQGLINGINSLKDSAVSLFKDLWSSIQNIFNNVGSFFKNIFSTAYTNIKNVFSNIGSFFSGIWAKIKSIFSTIGSSIGDSFSSAFKSVINWVLEKAEKAINAPINGINSVIGTINDIPGVKISKMSTISLPRLAEGTVIPPRHEFAAILGDQKHGTNIEAPLETIKQANREVLTEFLDKIGNLGTKVQEIILKNLTFVIQLGVKDFKKVVIEAVRLSEKELGKTLFVS